MRCRRSPRVRALRDRLHHGLSQGIEGLRLNGPPLDARVGNNLNLSFDGTEAEALLMSVRELCMSTGSACTSATLISVIRVLASSTTWRNRGL